MVSKDTRSTFPSNAFKIGPYWPGYTPDLKHLIVFGASYCDIGYSHHSPHPSPSNPLGVPFPGTTWAEPGQANWVGHLITHYPPPPISPIPTSISKSISPPNHHPILVYNYAVGGAMVDGVQYQVDRRFMSPGSVAPWSSKDTLFTTWIGINDCGRTSNFTAAMEKLFDSQEMLYNAGARNFLFINVPPVGRFGGRNSSNKNHKTWNRHLQSGMEAFTNAHTDVTTMVFSAWDLFHDVIDHPTEYGFTSEDVNASVGGFLVDGLHPTSRMHNIIAREVSTFLAAQQPIPSAD